MKRRSLTLGGLLLVAAVLAVWRFGYHGVDPRLIFWPPPGEVPPPAALDELAELDVTETSLDDVLKLLSGRYSVPIEIDSFAKKNTNVTGIEPVTFRLSGVSLNSLLAHLARPHGLVVRTRGGIVYLTTPSDWTDNKSNFTVRVHPLDRLLAGPHPIREAELAEAIEACLTKVRKRDSSWSSSEWNAGDVRAYPGALAVSQTPEIHARIARLLDVLAEIENRPDSLEPVWIDPPSPRTEAIYAALARGEETEFVDATLHDIVTHLAKEQRVPVVIHDKSQSRHISLPVEEEDPFGGQGDSVKPPNELRLTGRYSLESALRLMKERARLTHLIQDEAIAINSEDSEPNLAARVYPIADLLDSSRGIDKDDVLHAVHLAVRGYGQDGEMRCFSGCLLAEKSRDDHTRIERFLSELRCAVRPGLTRVSPKYQSDDLEADTFFITRCYRAPRPLSPGDKPTQPPTDDEDFSPGDPVFVLSKTVTVGGSSPTKNPDAWTDALFSTVEAETWHSAISHGDAYMLPLGDALVVSQTPEVHAILADLLPKLERLEHGPPRAEPVWVGQHARESFAKINAALSAKANVEFVDAELSDVAESLAQEYGIPLRLDLETLGKEMPQRRVTCKIRNVPLRLALSILLRDIDLNYVFRQDALWITTPLDKVGRLATRLYDVRDLMNSPDGQTPPIDVLELIRRSAGLTEADEGALAQVGGVLIATEPVEVQREIQDLLATLRALPRVPKGHSPLLVESSAGSRTAEIEASLTRRVHLSFLNRPLEEVLESLKREFDLPILFFPGELLQNEAQEPVTYEAQDVTLAEALDEILEPLLLDWRIQDGQLLVSSLAIVPQRPITRFYPIVDFLTDQPLPIPKSAVNLTPHLKPEPTYGERKPKVYPPRRHAFQNLLDRCFPELNYLSSQQLDWEFHGGYLVVSCNRRAAHRSVESALARLRETTPASSASPETASARPEFYRHTPRLEVFDLRPLLEKHPGLSERLARDWVCEWLHYDELPDRSPRRRASRSVAPLETWSGRLLIAGTPDDLEAAGAALAFLGSLPADLPRPVEVLRDDDQVAVAQIRAEVEKRLEPETLRRCYAFWLAGRMQTPPPEMVRAIIARLAPDDLTQDPRRQEDLRRALRRFGPAAAEAAPLVTRLLQHKNLDSRYAEKWSLTLASLGPRGIADLCRLAASGKQVYEFNPADLHLRDSPWREAGLLATLPLLYDSSLDRPQVLTVIAALDENGSLSRKLLDQWRAETKRGHHPGQLDEIERALNSQFGERRQK